MRTAQHTNVWCALGAARERAVALLLAFALTFMLAVAAAPLAAYAEDEPAAEETAPAVESTDAVDASASADAGTVESAESSLASTNILDPTQRADNSFIYDTSIESLFDQASLYNNRTVQVVGEVIGDRIRTIGEPNRYWITLTSTDESDTSSISVLLSGELVNQVGNYGRYGVTGTALQVRGTYNQACPEHEGLPDIHATDASVVDQGLAHPDEFNLGAFVPGLIGVVVGIILMVAFYFARERMR